MKVLLITYHPLLRVNGGTEMYKKIMKSFHADELDWLSTGYHTKRETYDDVTQYLKLEVNSLFFLDYFQRFLTKFPASIFYYFWYYRIYVKRVLKELYKRDLEKYDIIWVEHVKHNIYIAGELIRNGFQVHLSNNDDCSVNATFIENQFFLLDRFRKNLENCRSADFISDAMRKYYESLGLTLRPSIQIWLNEKYIRGNRNKFSSQYINILFYGNPHGLSPMTSFIKFIVSNSNLRLTIYGPAYLSRFISEKNNIFLNSFTDKKTLNSVLHKATFVYVPYSFKNSYKIVVSTSLPSKLIVALQLGVPIIAHCPKYSSLYRLILDYNLGLVIDSKSVGSDFLKKINSVTELEYEGWSHNCRNYYDSHLDPDMQINNFKSLLKLEYN